MIAKKISALVVVVWLYTTDQLKGMGFPFNEKQVKTKIHYLQNKFKKMVDANNTSGNGSKKWEFFEDMNDLMGAKQCAASECDRNVTFSRCRTNSLSQMTR